MKRQYLAKMCNVIGILLMLAVIVAMVPFTAPKLFGYRIYGVLTESMTPSYPVGSVVYIRPCEPETVQAGDVITFRMGTDTEYVMTHRVIDVDAVGRLFCTKGDANNAADAEPVAFDRLIGRAELCIPGLAALSELADSMTGRAVLFIAFALAFILWVTADLLSPKGSRGKKAAGKTGAADGLTAKEADSQGRSKPYGKGKKIRLAMRFAGLAMIAGAAVYLGSIFLQYRESETEYETLRKAVFTGSLSEEGSAGDGFAEKNSGDSGLAETDRKIMDAVRGLQEQNEDVTGWISFDELDLSYPVMHGEDNTYYLTHTFSGEKNSAGSIFMEAANAPDFEDSHTVIYGHNMKNLSMFGQLRNYRTRDFYEEHEFFTIYTENQIFRYQIFACYDIEESGEIYAIGFGPDEKFVSFLEGMKERSYFDTGVEVTAEDKVITLSTCSAKGKRFVVNAKRVETQAGR